MIVIRPFLFNDVEELAALMGELGYPTTKDRMLRRMEQMDSNPLYGTFMAEYEGKVVGMVGVRQLYDYESDDIAVQISALVIKSDYRGLGIGKRLVIQAEKWAKEHGAAGIVLTSGNRPEREAAHRFYQHLGYKLTGFRFSKRL